MNRIPDASEWAHAHFGQAELGDPRRTRRLVESAARIAEHPQKSFPSLFDWNGLRGFYNLCHKDQATHQAIQRPHWEITRRAMASEPLVLIPHDTTELDFTSHYALRGAGPIGDGGGRGFLQHNSLAFTPDGRLLGLAYQQVKVRRPAPQKETPQARKLRDRETLMWTEGIAACGRPPEGSTWVDVADRWADIYEVMEASRACGHHFLIRVCQDRAVEVAGPADQDTQQRAYLMRLARGLGCSGEDVVEIPGRGGRPARLAKVRLASAAVGVPPPPTTARRKSRPTLSAWVIRIWEYDAPADAEEALEWVLLCSLPTEGAEQIKQRRDWYALRWGAEVYHDVEKNGCSEEDRRFETASAMLACLAVLAVVAVRVYQLRLLARCCPGAPAQEAGTEVEVEVVRRHQGKPVRTVLDFVRGVASLGGFLGRKCDGEPGVRSLWRGYQRLQDMVVGYRLRPNPRKRTHGPPTE